MNRRQFLKTAAIAGAFVAAPSLALPELSPISEYVKCESDLAYFINNYCFKLYPYQEEMLRAIEGANRFTALPAPRQSGKSRVLNASNLHHAFFNRYSTIGLADSKASPCKESIAQITQLHNNLPEWLRSMNPLVQNNKCVLRFDNDSKIIAVGQNISNICGLSMTRLSMDNAAQVEDMFIECALPNLLCNRNSEFIMTSVPSGGYFNLACQGRTKIVWNVHRTGAVH